MPLDPADLSRRIAANSVPNTTLSTFGPMPAAWQQPQTPAAPPIAQGGYSAIADAAAAKAGSLKPPKGPDLPWWKDVLGVTLGNPIAKAILKPLEILDYGRAAVGSGVKELSDAFAASDVGRWLGTNGPDWLVTQRTPQEYEQYLKDIGAEGGFSWSDFTKQIGDKKGVGDYIEQVAPNRSLGYKRTIGVLGDVATDPLTYLTLGSAKAAGAGGRAAMAAKTADLTAEDLARLGASRAEMLDKVRKGAAWLSNEERAALGVEKAGLRVGFGEGVRIPGTEGISRVVGKGVGTARRVVSLPFRSAWHAIDTSPEGMQLIKRVLSSGAPIDGLTPEGAAAALRWRQLYDLSYGEIAKPASRTVETVLYKLSRDERAALTNALETGTTDGLNETAKRAYEVTKRTYDSLLATARKDIKIGELDNFSPHRWTDEARKFLETANVRVNGKPMQDLTKESGASLQRLIRGGEVTINGRTIDIGGGTVKEINDAFAKAFQDVKSVPKKWMEDDAAVVAASYINGIAKDIANVRAMKSMVNVDPTVANWLPLVSNTVLDKAATRALNKEMAQALGAEMDKRAAERVAEVDSAVATAQKLQKELTVQADAALKGMKRTLEGLGDTRRFVIDTGKSLDEQASALADHLGNARRLYVERINNAEQEVARLEDEVTKLAFTASAAPRQARDAVERSQQRLVAKAKAALEAKRAELELLRTDAGKLDESVKRLGDLTRQSRELAANADRPEWVRKLANQIDLERRQQFIPAAGEDIQQWQDNLAATLDRLRADPNTPPAQLAGLEKQLQDVNALAAGAPKDFAAFKNPPLDEARQRIATASGKLDEARVAQEAQVLGAKRAADKQAAAIEAALAPEQQALDAARATQREVMQGVPTRAQVGKEAATARERLVSAASELESARAFRDSQTEAWRKIGSEAKAEYDRIDAGKAIVQQYKSMVDKSVTDTKAEVKRLAATAKRVAAVAADKGDVSKTFDQLTALVDDLARSGDQELKPLIAMQKEYADRVMKLRKFDEGTDALKAERAIAKLAAKKGGENKGLAAVVKYQAMDGWTRVATELLRPEEAIAMREPVARALRQWQAAIDDGSAWKIIDKLTQFFKTYATSTPGFHVRNAMSATFMNTSDGVGLAEHLRAISAWKAYISDSENYLTKLASEDPKLYEAFRAVFGSGAGGQFSAEELAVKTGSKVLHNPVTKLSRRWGENVEGPVRLAMAVHEIETLGGDATSALNRIRRVHFDYSQVSKFDRNMKRIIPFWMFMSRNLPLQVHQMWTRPRAYAAWNHLVANVSAEDGANAPWMPSWLAAKNPIVANTLADGSKLVVSPDLQHLALGEDMASALDLRNPLAALSNMNPVFVAPLEAIAGKRFRFDTPIGGDPNPSLGERVGHVAMQTMPPIATVQRLLGLGRYDGKAPEKWANFLGIPVRTVTPEEQRKNAKYNRRSG